MPVPEMMQRIIRLRARYGDSELLDMLIDALYERGSLGELLDEVEVRAHA